MSVEVGVYLPQVGFAWEALRQRAQQCDRLGIDALWFMDHLYPPGMPDVPSFEGWTTATALAAVTERIRIGHLVLANGFRHPALLATMATTLDHASGGRLDVGLGSGSWPRELTEFGLEHPSATERSERLDEALTVLRALWTQPLVSFAGRHYRLTDAPSPLRPVQRPHPPIHVGGAAPRTLAIAARHADAWNCPTYALARLPELVDALRAACATAGRDPATLRVTEQAVLALVARRDRVADARALAERRFAGPGWGFETHGYCGTPDEVVARMDARRRLGVTGFVFVLHDRAEPETLELLAREVLPGARTAR